MNNGLSHSRRSASDRDYSVISSSIQESSVIPCYELTFDLYYQVVGNTRKDQD